MQERIMLADIGDGKGGVAFAKGEIYGPYPFSTWSDIARSAGKPLDKIAQTVEDRARESVARPKTARPKRRAA